MTSIYQLIFVIAFFVLLGLSIINWSRLRETKRDLQSLAKEVREKVGNVRFEWEEEKVRRLADEMAAIERHLNIEIVKEPARLAIKYRQCPSGF